MIPCTKAKSAGVSTVRRTSGRLRAAGGSRKCCAKFFQVLLDINRDMLAMVGQLAQAVRCRKSFERDRLRCGSVGQVLFHTKVKPPSLEHVDNTVDGADVDQGIIASCTDNDVRVIDFGCQAETSQDVQVGSTIDLCPKAACLRHQRVIFILGRGQNHDPVQGGSGLQPFGGAFQNAFTSECAIKPCQASAYCPCGPAESQESVSYPFDNLRILDFGLPFSPQSPVNCA